MDTMLSLLKSDLGVTHDLRNDYFTKLLTTAKSEIQAKGITLNEANVEDMMLISDYAAWQYRKRTENIGMSQSLQWRIRNRIVKARATSDV